MPHWCCFKTEKHVVFSKRRFQSLAARSGNWSCCRWPRCGDGSPEGCGWLHRRNNGKEDVKALNIHFCQKLSKLDSVFNLFNSFHDTSWRHTCQLPLGECYVLSFECDPTWPPVGDAGTGPTRSIQTINGHDSGTDWLEVPTIRPMF